MIIKPITTAAKANKNVKLYPRVMTFMSMDDRLRRPIHLTVQIGGQNAGEQLMERDPKIC